MLRTAEQKNLGLTDNYICSKLKILLEFEQSYEVNFLGRKKATFKRNKPLRIKIFSEDVLTVHL